MEIDEATEIYAEFTPEMTPEELEALGQSLGLSALQLVVDGTTYTGFQVSGDALVSESFVILPFAFVSDDSEAWTIFPQDPNFTPGAHVVSFAFVATTPTAAFTEAYQLASGGGGGTLYIEFGCGVDYGTDDPEVPFSALREAYLAGRAIHAVNIIWDYDGNPHEMPLEIAHVVLQDLEEEGTVVEVASFTFRGVPTVLRAEGDDKLYAYTVDILYNDANYAEETAVYKTEVYEVVASGGGYE